MDKHNIDFMTSAKNMAVDLSVVACVGSRRYKMRAEEISPSRMLLRTRHPVRPLDKIEIVSWITLDEQPIRAIIQAQYVERTFAGYRVDAAFWKICAEDCARWDEFLSKTMAACAALPRLPRFTDKRQPPQIVAIGNCLSHALRSELRRKGIVVHQAPTVARAMELLKLRPDILIADGMSSSIDIHALCRQISTQKGAPDMIFFIEYAREQELESYLDSGAARIIFKPSNQQMLIQQITTALMERTEVETAAYSSAKTLAPVIPLMRPQPESQEPGFWNSLRWQLRGLMDYALRSSVP